jgi:hypothetical protein
MTSLILLVSWEIWSECNARVSHNKHVPSQVVFDISNMRHVYGFWRKHLGDLMSGE